MKAHLLKHGMNTYSMKTCSYCDYTTHKTSILNKHLRTHSGEKMFLCDLCPKSYTSAVYLKEHKVGVGGRARGLMSSSPDHSHSFKIIVFGLVAGLQD